MKYLLNIGALLMIIMSSVISNAQESCKVLIPALADKYEGGCNKGKADGMGKAEGQDKYEGEFKNGIPEGKGIYTWKNGDIYNGDWVKGKREGTGEMVVKRNGRPDSVVTGFWKKDSYIGRYEKPFIVHFRSSQFSTINFSKNTKANNKESSIVIFVQNTTGGGTSLGSGQVPKPEISDIIIKSGGFLNSTTEMGGPKSTGKKLNRVDFPFRASIRIGNQEADIEILEPGEWRVQMSLNN